jgi:hypothetical protein
VVAVLLDCKKLRWDDALEVAEQDMSEPEKGVDHLGE